MFDSRRLQVEVTGDFGLHLRAANRWVQLTRRFESEVRVSWNGRAVDGKSILDLLTLGAQPGALLELEVTGPDSEEAAAALRKLAEDGLQDSNDGCGSPTVSEQSGS